MSINAIEVENLGKCYQIGELEDYYTLRDSLTNVIKFPFTLLSKNRKKNEKSEIEFIWALKDINFQVKHGEIIGIIGRNGAGKSTLLKILSRITTPTEGTIKIDGRVGSLLEVGTGFHPELTGRENIYLNGSILGMSKKEIERKFDEIVDFAETEKFLDTPVKRYSSGMYVRLAFAVAAHMEPEILIIDEVLAVGDIAFQRKCLGKMGDVSKEGRTVLFVSHNMSSIKSLTKNTLLLEDGKLIDYDVTPKVINKYILNQDTFNNNLNSKNQIDNEKLKILDIYSCNNELKKKNNFITSEEIRVFIKFILHKKIEPLRIGIDLINEYGEILIRTFDDDIERKIRSEGSYESVCTIPKNLLKPGIYELRLQIAEYAISWIVNDYHINFINIDHIDGVNSNYGEKRIGLLLLETDWNQRKLELREK